ncbi:MAG: methylmalonyl Co-A mutase-associated GTPase MeaB [Microthrixaceae bacterium]
MTLPSDPAELLSQARSGNRRALARALSVVERGGPEGAAVVRAAWAAEPDGAFTVGLTGAPGAGKSTLSASLCAELLRRERSVAVLAIDPSSPFSGGAILGDRVRMGDVAASEDIYIRSMATRGHLGGLAGATRDAISVLGAVGRDWVVVETVGVGQVETEIAGAADTTVVVVNPGWGDAIQANKAGLMEIADVFAVNKADRDGARDTVADLEAMLNLAGHPAWRPPVVATVGTTGEGAALLVDAIEAHSAHQRECGELARRRVNQRAERLTEVAGVRLKRSLDAVLDTDWGRSLRLEVEQAAIDPWSAADRLLDRVVERIRTDG